MDLYEFIANTHTIFSSDRTIPRKVAGIHEIDSQSATNAQLVALTKQVELLDRTQTRLCLGEVKATTVSLQLADRSIKHQRSVVDDVLIKVDKFFFSVDFIVLDIEEDWNMPVILGRPFLATSRALIDIEKCELILSLQDEQAIFSMYTIPKQPVDLRECFRVDEVVKIGQENCKPYTGGLVAIIKDEKGRFKIWRAKDKLCKADNCKQCKTFKAQFKPP
ncbi:Uncharacterized protein Adt_39376 [Abeliophyllum distichum]|uniref:Uncharacterized protein n=1 Tax=Abeliophyllum distichum TaxID=126358 RepID=A0ABD1Q4W7_9LAMI